MFQTSILRTCLPNIKPLIENDLTKLYNDFIKSNVYALALNLHKPISIQYMSNINAHQYEKFPEFPVEGEYLALLGNLGDPTKKQTHDLLAYSSLNFEKVYIVPSEKEQSIVNLPFIANDYPNIKYLFNGQQDDMNENIRVFGITLNKTEQNNLDLNFQLKLFKRFYPEKKALILSYNPPCNLPIINSSENNQILAWLYGKQTNNILDYNETINNLLLKGIYVGTNSINNKNIFKTQKVEIFYIS